MAKYRIMTFDGGGVRGALTVNLLKRLNKRFPELIKKTNFFAGTSSGSFIALALAYGLSVDELIDLYSEETARYIFTPKHIFLFKPKYNNEHLKRVLSVIFPPGLRLKDLKRRVLVPSFRVDGGNFIRWRPVLYNNFPYSYTKDEYVIDVALASSAAPIYFPSHHNHIDGGVIANNPSTAAIAMAICKNAGKQKLENIYLFSMGTGYTPHKINADTRRWGALEWMFNLRPPLPLFNILFDGDVEADALFTSQFLVDQYFRLNPMLPGVIALDEYQKIPYLVSIAQKIDLQPAIRWIAQKWFD
ncbi:patatin-like phospholipase/acyl hydrolase [Desulfohalotomaculum tongense]|uniref:patatin-like phospholipase family protein n=1 Tax=Desulforadius tongensis TaxID=1216062 RepID=UPI001957872F|nr:patatin-like phospholipase family protein [Desulforadius tongensis]MBM7854660.1 patatin-like phospholipase/acyl hydrolase [Desulforadius tongensis]